MKRGNHTGGITKLSGNRRKKWYARLTAGWKYVDRETGKEIEVTDKTDMSTVKAVQVYKNLGTYRTKAEAQEALNRALLDPYALSDDVTFAEVYDKWSAERYPDLAPSSVYFYQSGYKRCTPLYNLPMVSLRASHLEAVLFADDLTTANQRVVKQLINRLYNYAMRHEIVQKDYSKLVRPLYKSEPSTIHQRFTDEEIKTLWAHPHDPVIDLILIGIYSGWRPQELLLINRNTIDFEQGVMIGGIKTEAGKNRIVPIHSAVLPLIRSALDENNGYLISWNGNPIVYRTYLTWFKERMEQVGMHHLPHDSRHTFVSLAKEADVDEYCLKLMTGHSISDVTEKIYTHRQISQLKEEIEKIKKEAGD